MASSQFVVAIECEGFVHEGDPGTDGRPISESTANDLNNGKLEQLSDNYGLVESLVRDDGSGILYFEWDPPLENEDEDVAGAAQTWHSAKLYTDHTRSAVAGIGLQVNEVVISLRDGDWEPGTEGAKGDRPPVVV
jgi:hypothetical protein